MEDKLHTLFYSWWQIIKKRPYTTGIVIFLVVMLFIFLAYRFGWDWTGLDSGTSQITITSTSKVNYTATVPQPSKSLWDWLQLLAVLAIPAVVGLGAAWYTAQQVKVSDRENTDNQRNSALQAYFDKISELLLHENLRKSSPKGEVGKSELHLDEVNIIARVRTLTVLSELDGRRKGDLIKFLYEADLINNELESVIFLYDADLSGADLKKANLHNAYLSATNLSGANLREAVLSKAVLGGADLSKANLEKATLIKAQLGMARQWISTGPDFIQARIKKTKMCEANLTEANLSGADLSDADLSRANLNGAYLEGANLERANLKGAIGITNEELKKQAKSLKGATMIDGSIHDL